MKISYGKNPKSFSAKIFNGLDQLIHIQKTTKLKIEAIIVIEIIQILYYIFLPAGTVSWTFLGFDQPRKFLLFITKLSMITPLTSYSSFLTFGFLIICFFVLLTSVSILLIYYIYQINNNENYNSVIVTKYLIYYFSSKPIITLPILHLITNTVNCSLIEKTFPLEEINCYSGQHLVLLIISIIMIIELIFLIFIQINFLFNFTLNFKITFNFIKPDFLRYLKFFKVTLAIVVEELVDRLDKYNTIIAVIIVILAVGLYNKVRHYYIFIDKKTYNCYYSLGLITLYAAVLMFVDHILFVLKLEAFQIYFELLIIGIIMISLIVIFKADNEIEILSVKLSSSKTSDEALYKIIFLQKLIQGNSKSKKNQVLLQGYILDHELSCNLHDCNLSKYKNKVLLKMYSGNNNKNEGKTNNAQNQVKQSQKIKGIVAQKKSTDEINPIIKSGLLLKTTKEREREKDRGDRERDREDSQSVSAHSAKSNKSSNVSKSVNSYQESDNNSSNDDKSETTNLHLLQDDDKELELSDSEKDPEFEDIESMENNRMFGKDLSDSNQFLFLHIEREYERYSLKFADNFYLKFFYSQMLVNEFYNYSKALKVLREIEQKAISFSQKFMIHTMITRIQIYQQDLNLYLELELNQDRNKDEILSNLKFISLADDYKRKIEDAGEQLVDFWENFKATSDINKIKSKGYKVCDTIQEIFELYFQLERLNNKSSEIQWLHGVFLCEVIDDKTLGKDLVEQSKQNLSTFQWKTIKFNVEEILSKGYSTCISVFKDNRGAEITRSSMQFARLFGYSSYELEGKNVNFLLPKIFSLFHNKIIHDYNENAAIAVSKSTRKVIKGIAIHKSGFIFKIHTNVTRIPSFKFDKSYLIRVLSSEKLTDSYSGYFITDKHLNISYISSEIPIIFGINEKETVLIRNSHMLKTMDRFNLTEFIQEFKITRQDFMSLEESLMNLNKKDGIISANTDVYFNIEGNYSNEQKINMLIEKKIEDYKAKEQINETKYHFFVGNFSKKANSYHILIDDFFKFQNDRRRSSNNRLVFNSKNLLTNNNENSIEQIFKQSSQNISNKNLLMRLNNDETKFYNFDERKIVEGKLEINKLLFGQYDTEYLLIKATINLSFRKQHKEFINIKFLPSFEFVYDEESNTTKLNKAERKQSSLNKQRDYEGPSPFKRSKTNVNLKKNYDEFELEEQPKKKSNYVIHSPAYIPESHQTDNYQELEIHSISKLQNNHKFIPNTNIYNVKTFRKSVSFTDDNTRNKYKTVSDVNQHAVEQNSNNNINKKNNLTKNHNKKYDNYNYNNYNQQNSDSIALQSFDQYKPSKVTDSMVGAGDIIGVSKQKSLLKTTSFNSNINNKPGLEEELGITYYGNDITLYKLDLKTYNLTKTYNIQYLNERKIMEITEETVPINDENFDDSDDEINNVNLENTKVEVRKADVLSQTDSKHSFTGLNLVIYFSYLVIIIHCILTIVSFVLYNHSISSLSTLINTVATTGSSMNMTLGIADYITNMKIVYNPLIENSALEGIKDEISNGDSTNYKQKFLEKMIKLYSDDSLYLYIKNTHLANYISVHRKLFFGSYDLSNRFVFNSTNIYLNKNYNPQKTPNVIVNKLTNASDPVEIENSKYKIFFTPVHIMEGNMNELSNNENLILKINNNKFNFEDNYDKDYFYVLSNFLNSKLSMYEAIQSKIDSVIKEMDYKKVQIIIMIVSSIVSAGIIYTTFHFMQSTLYKIYDIYYEILNISSNEVMTITNSYRNFVKLTKNIIDEEDIEDNIEEAKAVKDAKKKSKISKDLIKKNDFTFYKLLVVSIPLSFVMLMHFLSIYLQMSNLTNNSLAYKEEFQTVIDYNKYCYLSAISVKLNVTDNMLYTIEYRETNEVEFFINKYISVYEKLINNLSSSQISSIMQAIKLDINFKKHLSVTSNSSTNTISLEYASIETSDRLMNYVDHFINLKKIYNKQDALRTLLNSEDTQHILIDRLTSTNLIFNVLFEKTHTDYHSYEKALKAKLNILFYVISIITLSLFFFVWLPTEKNIIVENNKIKKLVLLLPTKVIKKKTKILEMLKEEGYVSIISNNVS